MSLLSVSTQTFITEVTPKPPTCAAQVLYGPKSQVVARTLCLLAALHLQKWDYCRGSDSTAEPAHLLRSVNMATSAAQIYSVRSLRRPGVASRCPLQASVSSYSALSTLTHVD